MTNNFYKSRMMSIIFFLFAVSPFVIVTVRAFLGLETIDFVSGALLSMLFTGPLAAVVWRFALPTDTPAVLKSIEVGQEVSVVSLICGVLFFVILLSALGLL